MAAVELSLLAFIDYGAVWDRTAAPYEFAAALRLPAGFGVRVGLGERLIATGLVAQPLTYELQARRPGGGADHAIALHARPAILEFNPRSYPCLACRPY